ncbi:MAG: type II toxin-antitoxin system RelE/ParE family toxin [Thermoplasmatales archaeon]|nr:type II toxin-antitoxin system RelE/ParE family toxin [Thermoplasmatales archaeon]
MSFEIVWSDRAIEQTRAFNKSIAKRIIKKIEGIKDQPEHFLETLENTKFFKLRVGKYRAIVDLKRKEEIIKIIYIEKRSKIYKRFRF